MRRTTLSLALVTAALTAIAVPAAAQQSYAPPPGAQRSYAPPGPPSAATIEQNLSNLHNRLMLTTEQEPAWRAFFDAMRQQAEQMQAAGARMAAQVSTTAPERFAQMAQAMQQGAASMNGVAQALGALYATLTPEQRTIVENEFPARGGPRPGPAPGMAGGGPPLR
jgi:protein CpxP